MARIVLTAPFSRIFWRRSRPPATAYGGGGRTGPMAREELVESAAGAEALICLLSDRIDVALLQDAVSLRILANVAVGYENIDVAAARSRGIAVANTPDVLTETTADLTFGLILAVARRIAEADDTVRRGGSPSWGLDQPLMGTDVHGRTLGIYGMGRIGAAVGRRARFGFGMRVLYHSRSPHPAVEEEIGATWVPFDQLLAESDFLSIHAPGTPETFKRFDRAAFRAMKRTAILINAARGSIVDEEALVHALNERFIAGAGLDVYEAEPNVSRSLIGLRDRVVLTPHLGSATHETRHAMASLAVDNVLAVLSGRPPITPVP